MSPWKKNLRFSTFNLPPWLYLETQNDDVIKVWGPLGNLFHYICQQPEIVSCTIQDHPGKQHGGRKGDNWTGVIGSLQRNEADVGLLPFSATQERSEAMDFTGPFWYSYFTVLGPLFTETQRDVFAIFKIFSFSVWMAIIGAILVVTLVSFFLENFGPNSEGSLWSPSASFWGIFGTLFNQGPNETPDTNRSRVVYGVWLLMVVGLVNTFGSSLMAKMTVVSKPAQIESVLDLVKYPKMQPLVGNGSVTSRHIKRSEDPIFKALWSQVLRTKGIVKLADVISSQSLEDTNQGRSAIVTEYQELKYGVGKACSAGKQFYIGNKPYITGTISVGLRRDMESFLKDYANNRLLYFTATGHIHYLFRKAFLKGLLCENGVSERKETPLGLNDLVPAFLIWSIGIASAIVAFTGETLILLKEGFRNLLKLLKGE